MAPNIYSERHPNWRVFSTIDNFYEVIAGAEIVIAPPGSTPLEAVAYGKPVVIVRYPEWSRAGTLEDARLFSEKLNAPVLTSLTSEAIMKSIIETGSKKKPNLDNGAQRLAEYLVEEG